MSLSVNRSIPCLMILFAPFLPHPSTPCWRPWISSSCCQGPGGKVCQLFLTQRNTVQLPWHWQHDLHSCWQSNRIYIGIQILISNFLNLSPIRCFDKLTGTELQPNLNPIPWMVLTSRPYSLWRYSTTLAALMPAKVVFPIIPKPQRIPRMLKWGVIPASADLLK